MTRRCKTSKRNRTHKTHKTHKIKEGNQKVQLKVLLDNADESEPENITNKMNAEQKQAILNLFNKTKNTKTLKSQVVKYKNNDETPIPFSHNANEPPLSQYVIVDAIYNKSKNSLTVIIMPLHFLDPTEYENEGFSTDEDNSV